MRTNLQSISLLTETNSSYFFCYAIIRNANFTDTQKQGLSQSAE